MELFLIMQNIKTYKRLLNLQTELCKKNKIDTENDKKVIHLKENLLKWELKLNK